MDYKQTQLNSYQKIKEQFQSQLKKLFKQTLILQ